MARYKPVDPHLSKLLPVRFSEQILPGTFEYALNWLVDHEIDLSVFDARYRNDETGASAYHPGVLLKVVLLGYCTGPNLVSQYRTRLPRKHRLHGLVWRYGAALHHHCLVHLETAVGDYGGVS